MHTRVGVNSISSQKVDPIPNVPNWKALKRIGISVLPELTVI